MTPSSRIDEPLKAAVLEELRWEPSVVQTHIEVAVRAGVVTLSGSAPSLAGRDAAERAAQRVKGVKAVVTDMDVRLPPTVRRKDEEIAAAMLERLAWDAEVPQGAIMVKVSGGRVTLTGQVDHHFQKQAGEQDARRLSGVIGVVNEVVIRPHIDTPHLSEAIQHALNRSWFFDPELVHVSAQEGRVKLTGTVPTPWDRNNAALTAWSAPGATFVENDIRIG